MQTTDNKTYKESSSHRSEFVPQWAKKVIWYQIFPERFRNGDTSNDPSVRDILGADPQEPPSNWEVHPWGSDWYELQEYELKNGGPDLWKHILRRRYGGDIQGIIDKLDYLNDLGITAIYLNPIFDSPSLHKYDGASYHHIDPNFGPDPEGDRILMESEDPIDPSTWVWTSADELVLKLIEEVHRRGMRIIFDGVFNHMGINSFAFRDLEKNQKKSKYKNWFTVTSWRDDKKGSKFKYEGWYGVKTLPELREDENGIVSGPREYIFAATERWMNPKDKGPAYGIDGWRLDVAYCIKHQFWKDWRKHVKSINPEAYLTAEIVDKPEKVEPYLRGDEFDGEMNYNFAFACAEFFINKSPHKISPVEFSDKLKYLRNIYPPGVAYVSQNLFGSHDANRIGSHIVNRGIGNYRDWGEYFGLSQAINNPEYSIRKPTLKEIRIQKLFVIFQMTYVGAPMIYYGDEAGMWGGNDPDCRKPMIWEDITYSPERYMPDGTTRKPDTVGINRDLLNHYKRLIEIRNKYQELQIGDYKTILTDNKRNLFVFERNYQGNRIIVALNNSNRKVFLVIAELDEGNWEDELDASFEIENYKSTGIPIPPKWGRIMIKR